MKIVDKCILKEILKYTGICMLIFITIYLIIDFLQKIDNFMEAGVTKGVIMRYFICKLPFIIVQMTPISLLISVIVAYSLMRKNNELIALQASGIGIRRVSLPALGLSFIMVVFSFLLSEFVVPYTSSKAEAIWNKDVRKGKYKRFFRRRHIWYKGNNSIYCIEYFNGKDKLMERAVFYFFDRNFSVVKRIQAEKVVWVDGMWIAKEAIIQTKKIGNPGYDIERFDNIRINIPETPESFLRPVRRPEEMNYWQLKRFAEEIKREGYDAKRYFVDTYMKLSFPFINLVVVLVGIPAALKIKGTGIPVSISIGVGICFLYIVCMGVFRSLGISGVIPPFLSAWMANIIFLLFGIHMMIHIER